MLAYRKAGLLFLLLWLGAFICALASRDNSPKPFPSLTVIMRRLALIAPFRMGLVLTMLAMKPTPEDLMARAAMQAILKRFVRLGGLLTLAVWRLLPSFFLALPRQHPLFWLLIMALYPLLSVWPQEMIYRRFLFHRYSRLFPKPQWMIAASALAFGFAHIIFLNMVAVPLTIAGGWLFAQSYARHRSLRLACFEHALYGCLIFTIGLGQYFYTGSAWHH
ncbi:MAG TPA: CPBP family intramembrane metalloprotease [Acidocella sp.]|nr:CPBP family intramembrane metalloprotease [Acidocella sp.]